jgi:hypothetical protein
MFDDFIKDLDSTPNIAVAPHNSLTRTQIQLYVVVGGEST